MFKIENDNIECENLKANQGIECQALRATDGIEVAGQVMVGQGGLMNAFKGTTTNGDWTTILSAEVPVGLSENLLLQMIAREPATGETAMMTYNGMVVSNPGLGGLTLTPPDVMNSLDKRLNTAGAADWMFRVVMAEEVTVDSNPPSHNIQLQVKGEADKTIKWVTFHNMALVIDSE